MQRHPKIAIKNSSTNPHPKLFQLLHQLAFRVIHNIQMKVVLNKEQINLVLLQAAIFQQLTMVDMMVVVMVVIKVTTITNGSPNKRIR